MKNKPGTRIKLNMLRKTMIKNFDKSINVAAQSTVAMEMDMTNLKKIKETLDEKGFATKQVKLSYLSLFIFIVSRVLKKHPSLNSKLDLSNNEIIFEKDINIGFAVAVERGNLPGLLMPVIRNADERNLSDIAVAIQSLTDKALDSSISLEDMTGGTFSISSVGSSQVDFIQPLLNFPEGAILGITRIKEKPIVKQGKIYITPMSNFCITVDHRIIDGVATYNFLEDLQQEIYRIRKNSFNI